jgi:hypothetical protein
MIATAVLPAEYLCFLLYWNWSLARSLKSAWLSTQPESRHQTLGFNRRQRRLRDHHILSLIARCRRRRR